MRQAAHNGSVLRQSQTAISAQIRGAAGMRVGRRRAPPLPDGHLSIAAKRSANREDIGSAATDATWRSPTGVCPRSRTGLRTPGSVRCGSG